MTLTAKSIKDQISSVFPISHFWKADFPPLLAMTVCVGMARSCSKPCCAASAFKSEQTTCAPSRPIASAIARPMPDDDPVTTATRPWSRPDPSNLYGSSCDMVVVGMRNMGY